MGSTDLQKEGSGVDLQMAPCETGLVALLSAKDGETKNGSRRRYDENVTKQKSLEEAIEEIKTES